MGAYIQEFRPDLCTACGDCVVVCPAQGIPMVGGMPSFPDNPACGDCGECEAICPTGAIGVSLEVVEADSSD